MADREAPPRALVEALREEPIDAVRMQRAYARFLQKRAVPAPRWRAPQVARWAAAAVVVGVSSVYAATLIRPFSSTPHSTETSTPASLPSVVSRGSKPAARPRPEPAAPLEANAAPTADPSIEPESGSRAAAPEQPSRSVAAAPSADQWQRAARGLRDGDFQSANAALKELTRRGTEEDRESALLVQAQVLLAQGRDAEAGSLLKSLAASAHAPSVRRKSTELLARLRERPAQPRSGSDLR